MPTLYDMFYKFLIDCAGVNKPCVSFCVVSQRKGEKG